MSALTMSSSQLEVVKRTVAKDLTNTEFDLFIEMAKQTTLDPFRKQIVPVIFNKDKPDKRTMTIIYSRDGLRCIASRCGNYRPKSKPSIFQYDDELKSPTNPLGVVSVTITLHWQDKGGKWHDVIGEAYWDEYAPVTKEWGYNEERGKRLPTGNETLEPMWLKMPRNMIEKCAESQALRAGWPEQFAGLYGEEEMAKSINEDRSASELAEVGRIQRIEKSTQYQNSVAFNIEGTMEYVRIGEVHDFWMKLIRDKYPNNPEEVLAMVRNNKQPLIHYWQMDADAALGLKKEFEKLEKLIDHEGVAA